MAADPLPASAAGAPRGECRCLCGSLVARMVDGGVELKCRRCKRILIVPVEGLAERVDGIPAVATG